MSATDFQSWLDHMGLKQKEVMVLLGIKTRTTIIKYKTEGTPLYIALACAALANDLKPWGAT